MLFELNVHCIKWKVQRLAATVWLGILIPHWGCRLPVDQAMLISVYCYAGFQRALVVYSRCNCGTTMAAFHQAGTSVGLSSETHAPVCSAEYAHLHARTQACTHAHMHTQNHLHSEWFGLMVQTLVTVRAELSSFAQQWSWKLSCHFVCLSVCLSVHQHDFLNIRGWTFMKIFKQHCFYLVLNCFSVLMQRMYLHY